MSEFVNRSERRMRRHQESSDAPALQASDEASSSPSLGGEATNPGVGPGAPPLEPRFVPLDTYAHSGVPVLVRSAGGVTAEAYYHRTRRIENGQWTPTAVWSLRNASGSYVPFEPVEYMMLP